MTNSIPLHGRVVVFVLAAMAILGLLPLNAHAQSQGAAQATGDSIWTRDKLTGDWGGVRSDLAKHGIDIGLRLSQYGQWVAAGGVDESAEYGGTMDYRLHVDGGKLLGVKGLSFAVHARTRFGQDILSDAGELTLPNTGLLSQLPGAYHGTDVTGATASYIFPFFAGRLGNVTVGKLDVVDTVNGFFPNLGYGQEGFWNINSTVSTLPWFGAVRGLSLYGGLAATINQEYGMIESGFIVTGTENVSTSWGSVSDSFDDVWLAAWHRFFWKAGDKPGYFMVFGGASTKEQSSNDPNDIVVVPGQGLVNTEQKKPWDIALYLYQELWHAPGNPGRKVTFLAGGTVGPDNPQFSQYNVFANVEGYGLIKSRPHDRMGVAGFWNSISPDVKELVSPLDELRNIWGVELYYNFAITKWAHLSGDLQLVRNERDSVNVGPNRRSSDDLALIPGVRLVVDF